MELSISVLEPGRDPVLLGGSPVTASQLPSNIPSPTKNVALDDDHKTPRLVCQGTTGKWGGNLRLTLSFIVMSISLIVIGGLVSTLVSGMLGKLIIWGAMLLWPLSVFTLLFGFPGYVRLADCLICGSRISFPRHRQGGNCPGCQTRLVLRGDELRYMKVQAGSS
jgi:DNA-directed RNA polymerase subunit RPC12/RpoP